MSKHKEADVLIIGAGAAGLTAASELSAAGLRIVVLEARGRHGGRIFTQRDPSVPVPIELGAEFVHGKSPEIFDLVEPAGLLLCDTINRHWYLRKGSLTKSWDFWQQLDELMDQMSSVGDADCSFQEFLDSLPDDERTRETKAIATLYVQGFHAARTERVGVHGLLRANEAADRIEGDKQFRILGGYDGLVEWLAGRATLQGTVIHLNTIAEEIRWKPKQVEVTSKTKDTTTRFAAARALVTLPLGVLQARTRELGAVQFVPALSQEKQDAIRHLAMGDVLRITLRFRKRFWEELKLSTDVGQEKLADLSFISSDLAFPTWWTQLPVRAPVMVGWVGGPRAEELVSRDDEFIRDQAVLSLTAILGITAREMRDLFQSCHMHNWHTDPFARGAYSYVPVNGLQAQLSLCRPLDGTLFFAGEATCVDGHVGTVHGAMASGKRAASEILASF